MALTLSAARERLDRRLGPYAALADLPAALAVAVREAGVFPPDPVAAADADLLLVPPADYGKVLDVAEYVAFEDIVANSTDAMLAQIGVGGDADKVRALLDRRAARLRTQVSEKWGYGYQALEGGVVNFGTDAAGDEVVY